MGLKTITIKKILNLVNFKEDVDVIFLLSISNSLKYALLKTARLLIYTPSNEHFGIVPLEAMLSGIPVLAANTGGPLETVVDGKSGWLCPPEDVQRWTIVMHDVLINLSDQKIYQIGKFGSERVRNTFSDTQMIENLENTVLSLADTSRRSTRELILFLLSIILALLDILFFFTSRNKLLRNWDEILLVSPLFITLTVILSWIGYFLIA